MRGILFDGLEGRLGEPRASWVVSRVNEQRHPLCVIDICLGHSLLVSTVPARGPQGVGGRDCVNSERLWVPVAVVHGG